MSEMKTDDRERRSFLHRWRWLIWPAAVVGALLLAVYMVGPRVATPIIRGKLDAMVRSQLNARLEMGSVSYRFPYGVQVRDAALVADDPRGGTVKLLEIPSLRIALAKLPFGNGPLVVKRIVLDGPAVHLIKTPDGLLGGKLVRPRDERPADMKLSEMFQLRLVTITGGQIVYEDRTKPDTAPAAWRSIDVKLTTTPKASPIYAFDFTAVSRPLASISAAGTFDIDDLYLRAEKLVMEFTASADGSESPAPAELQQLLAQFGVAGKVRLEARAQVPLRNLNAARFDAKVGISDATATLPGGEERLDDVRADIQVSTAPLTAVQELKNTAILLRQGKPVPSTYPTTREGTGTPSAIDDLQATAGHLRRDRAIATTSPAEDSELALDQLRQTAIALHQEQATTLPTTSPATAPASPAPAVYALIENAAVTVGDNRLVVSKAGLTIDWDEMSWRLGPVNAILTLGADQQSLPRTVRKVNEDMLLEGTADVSMSGHGSLLPRADGKPDYTLNIRAESPQMLVTDRRLMVTNVRADVLVTPAGVSFPDDGVTRHGLYGEFYGGAVRATGQVRTGKPVQYAFIVRASGVNMQQFGQAWPEAGKEPLAMTGTGAGRMHIHGTGRVGDTPAIAAIRGYGDFEVRDGDFYQLPVLAQLLNGMNQKAEPGTVGYAAGVFDVRHKTIRLSKVAVSAPVLGIQGSGEVNFDSELDLKVVAAPLADWKRSLKKTNIPLISDVASELAGGIQKLLNTATGKLLYQFRITGKLGDPKVTPQPVPVLTDDMLQVFAHMLKGGDQLLDQIKR